jgi:hypothetical protein
MASDEVGATQIDPPVSGQHLDSWLGLQRTLFKKTRNDDTDGTSSVEIRQVGMPYEDTDDFSSPGKYAAIDELVLKLKPMKVGQTWSFPTASESESKALSLILRRAVRRLGWRSASNHQKAYVTKILPDRLKVKRLA